MEILVGDSIAAYIGERLRVTLHPPYVAIGFVGAPTLAGEGPRPLAAALFNNLNAGGNVDLTLVAEPGGLTREVIRYLCRYAFIKNGCRRVQAHVRRRNKSLLKIMPRAGFVYEAVAPGYYPDDDAVVFRMLRANCRWIDEFSQPSQAAGSGQDFGRPGRRQHDDGSDPADPEPDQSTRSDRLAHL